MEPPALDEHVIHAVFVCHGLHGSPTRVAPVADCIRTSIGDAKHTVVHVIQCNSDNFFATHRGVKVGGDLTAAEITDVVRRYPNTRFVSLIGLSLGGLYIRAAAPVIEALGLTPLNFISIASPHLGVRGHLWSFVESAIRWGAIGQTGYDLLVCDNTGEDGMPILQWMADKRSPYFKALQRFSNKVLLANVVGDDKVPHWSAALVGSTAMLKMLAEEKPSAVKSCYVKPIPGSTSSPLCTGVSYVETAEPIPMDAFHHVSAIYSQPSAGSLVNSGSAMSDAVESNVSASTEATARNDEIRFFMNEGSDDPLNTSATLEAQMAENLRSIGGWINVDVLFEEFGASVLNHIRIGGGIPPKWVRTLYDTGPSAGADVLAFVGSHLFRHATPEHATRKHGERIA